MRELRAGLWHWQALHPLWTPADPWPQLVSSYAFDDGAQLVLFDPLSVPEELVGLAATRETAVVLTAPWHERDTHGLVDRLDTPVYAPPPDTAYDVAQKYGIDSAEAAAGSPDLDWLLDGGGEAHFYTAGDPLPMGIEALQGREYNDLVLWVGRAGAVISGDTLVDFGAGLEINQRLSGGVTHEVVAARLRPILGRPIDLVLPTHGAPTDRPALERALAWRGSEVS